MNWKALPLAALGVLLMAPQHLKATDAATVDAPAPAFALTDQNGTPRSLGDFRGKVVVLEWVNFGCPFVRKHYDSGNMQKLQKEYTAKGVVWLSLISSAPGKQGYFEADELKQRLAMEKAVPTACLIDADGTVGKAIDDIASTDTDDIAKATNHVSASLDAVMAGNEVPVKSTKPYGCGVKYR